MTAPVLHSLPRLSAVIGVLALCACSVLSRPDPPTVYRLPLPAAVPTLSVAAPAWSLQVGTPLAADTINRSAITVLPRPDQVNNYRGARWSEPAPVLLRDALVSELQASHPAAVITSDDSDLPTRYKLLGRLDAFQSEYLHGQPHIVIRYQAQLQARDGREALAVHGFEVSLRPASAQLADVVAGFGQAVQQLDMQLQQWLSTVMAADTAKAAPPSP